MTQVRVLVGLLGTALCACVSFAEGQQQVAARGDDKQIQPAFASLPARPITLSVSDVSLRQMLNMIAAQAKVLIQYEVSTVDAYTKTVSLEVRNAPLNAVLDRILSGTTLRAVADGQTQIAIIESGESRSGLNMQGIIVGKVISAKTRQPVAGATVTVGGNSMATLPDGTFRIAADAGTYSVYIRAIGFTRHTLRTVVKTGESTTVEVALDPTASVLDEVVVTGTVVETERRAIPNPITVITAAEIERRGITRIEQFFRGEVPGVIALEKGAKVYYGGELGQTTSSLGSMARSDVYARGASSLARIPEAGSMTPNALKTYVDGVELLDPTYLGTIDLKGVDRIEIITGPQAATIYGSGAMGGVMQIFTKKGNGRNHTEFTLSAKYGVLENNLSAGRTPMHNHTLNATGGAGPAFSYSGTLGYMYTGQWQPALFNQSYSATIGATHQNGPVTVSGSVGTTLGRNGTSTGADGALLLAQNLADGVWEQQGIPGSYFMAQRISISSSQNLSLSLDYRPTPIWQHHFTVGRNQTTFTLDPEQPRWAMPSDSLWSKATSTGQRLTTSYNTTIQTPIGNVLSSTLTVGVNGSRGDQLQVDGCTATPSAPAIVGCAFGQVTVMKTKDTESWGGFGSWQVGMWNSLYLTLGLRAERNPAYGREHKVDWTPTNGLTYTLEFGDVSLKLLGSYGRATRPPNPDWRLRKEETIEGTTVVTQLENLALTPEYSGGPQGGFELYYGNGGSLTVNHYTQKVTNLVQRLKVDSTFVTNQQFGFSYWRQTDQYMNVATIRQRGWETTASANISVLALKGTYSWTHSEELAANPLAFAYQPGKAFVGIPTHSANVTASYAHRNTSVTLVANYVGSSPQDGASLWLLENQIRRIKMYMDRLNLTQSMLSWSKSGYVKSDVAATHRLAPWASATLNIINVGNSYGSEVMEVFPTLGRQTLIGVSLRYPQQ